MKNRILHILMLLTIVVGILGVMPQGASAHHGAYIGIPAVGLIRGTSTAYGEICIKQDISFAPDKYLRCATGAWVQHNCPAGGGAKNLYTESVAGGHTAQSGRIRVYC